MTELMYYWGDGSLQNSLGITLTRYHRMLEEQHYTCPICGTSLRDLPRRPPVDHDHETEEIRKILCQSCNMGLGFFKDNIQNLARAIIYLQDHGKT